MLAAVAICGALVITVRPRAAGNCWAIAGLVEPASSSTTWPGCSNAQTRAASSALSPRSRVRRSRSGVPGRWQHGATVNALAHALCGQFAQIAADRIFGHGIAARQFGGDYAALLAQFLEDLPGALGGEGLGSELMLQVCTVVH